MIIIWLFMVIVMVIVMVIIMVIVMVMVIAYSIFPLAVTPGSMKSGVLSSNVCQMQHAQTNGSIGKTKWTQRSTLSLMPSSSFLTPSRGA
jgi:hypothetical protein